MSQVLEVPSEPLALKQELAEMVREKPFDWPAVASKGAGLVDPLWECWGEVLSAGGMTRALFIDILAGYDHEVWLWLVGERTWAQSAEGLAGRLVRRAPGALRASGVVGAPSASSGEPQ